MYRSRSLHLQGLSRNFSRIFGRQIHGLSSSIGEKPSNTLTDINAHRIQGSEDGPKAQHERVNRILLKTQNSKRGSLDECRQENIRFLDISKALQIHSKQHQPLMIDQIENDIQIIDNFLHKNRPEVEIKDVQIIFETVEGEGVGIVRHEYENTVKHTVVCVPKTVEGDIVTLRLRMHHKFYAEGHLVTVQTPSAKRNDSLIDCHQFNSCNGCQLQMVSYGDQLHFKREVLHRAYEYFYPNVFSQIPPPNMGSIIASPKEYNYRTKLTPHYKWRNSFLGKEGYKPPIGFENVKPSEPLVDVEKCSIATRTINDQLSKFRENVYRELANKKKTKKNASTGLLRESIDINLDTGDFSLTTITDNKKLVTEKVEDIVYQFPAGEFFQTNNSILPVILQHIRSHLKEIDYSNIIDTYCGSGFFGIALAKDLPSKGKVFGVEISSVAIKYAQHNAKINGLTDDRVMFVSGTADTIFSNNQLRKVKGKDSVVIMDPSRKGSNIDFLKQMLEFKPKMIIYVSCNVFTQARDLRQFHELQKDNIQYRVKEITGFDFFPQTKHVEGLAVLELCT
ncbi:tRNA (uracil(54)-C(5))-methyltransferase [[Candida] jaroonii]|uniref:tRNA (Uracil(54)-C(5))-methyltransferase n=1 Tax=[Candida] jaroonii TaxID=467808 RepID=A0ACA9Y987_9ASCO|nr:tRNA (uracil(54)-C(5))-methyltransferase [[Candida] jaroonii]